MSYHHSHDPNGPRLPQQHPQQHQQQHSQQFYQDPTNSQGHNNDPNFHHDPNYSYNQYHGHGQPQGPQPHPQFYQGLGQQHPHHPSHPYFEQPDYYNAAIIKLASEVADQHSPIPNKLSLDTSMLPHYQKLTPLEEELLTEVFANNDFLKLFISVFCCMSSMDQVLSISDSNPVDYVLERALDSNGRQLDPNNPNFKQFARLCTSNMPSKPNSDPASFTPEEFFRQVAPPLMHYPFPHHVALSKGQGELFSSISASAGPPPPTQLGLAGFNKPYMFPPAVYHIRQTTLCFVLSQVMHKVVKIKAKHARRQMFIRNHYEGTLIIPEMHESTLQSQHLHNLPTVLSNIPCTAQELSDLDRKFIMREHPSLSSYVFDRNSVSQGSTSLTTMSFVEQQWYLSLVWHLYVASLCTEYFFHDVVSLSAAFDSSQSRDKTNLTAAFLSSTRIQHTFLYELLGHVKGAGFGTLLHYFKVHSLDPIQLLRAQSNNLSRLHSLSKDTTVDSVSSIRLTPELVNVFLIDPSTQALDATMPQVDLFNMVEFGGKSSPKPIPDSRDAFYLNGQHSGNTHSVPQGIHGFHSETLKHLANKGSPLTKVSEHDTVTSPATLSTKTFHIARSGSHNTPNSPAQSSHDTGKVTSHKFCSCGESMLKHLQSALGKGGLDAEKPLPPHFTCTLRNPNSRFSATQKTSKCLRQSSTPTRITYTGRLMSSQTSFFRFRNPDYDKIVKEDNRLTQDFLSGNLGVLGNQFLTPAASQNIATAISTLGGGNVEDIHSIVPSKLNNAQVDADGSTQLILAPSNNTLPHNNCLFSYIQHQISSLANGPDFALNLASMRCCCIICLTTTIMGISLCPRFNFNQYIAQARLQSKFAYASALSYNVIAFCATCRLGNYYSSVCHKYARILSQVLFHQGLQADLFQNGRNPIDFFRGMRLQYFAAPESERDRLSTQLYFGMQGMFGPDVVMINENTEVIDNGFVFDLWLYVMLRLHDPVSANETLNIMYDPYPTTGQAEIASFLAPLAPHTVKRKLPSGATEIVNTVPSEENPNSWQQRGNTPSTPGPGQSNLPLTTSDTNTEMFDTSHFVQIPYIDHYNSNTKNSTVLQNLRATTSSHNSTSPYNSMTNHRVSPHMSDTYSSPFQHQSTQSLTSPSPHHNYPSTHQFSHDYDTATVLEPSESQMHSPLYSSTVQHQQASLATSITVCIPMFDAVSAAALGSVVAEDTFLLLKSHRAFTFNAEKIAQLTDYCLKIDPIFRPSIDILCNNNLFFKPETMEEFESIQGRLYHGLSHSGFHGYVEVPSLFPEPNEGGTTSPPPQLISLQTQKQQKMMQIPLTCVEFLPFAWEYCYYYSNATFQPDDPQALKKLITTYPTTISTDVNDLAKCFPFPDKIPSLFQKPDVLSTQSELVSVNPLLPAQQDQRPRQQRQPSSPQTFSSSPCYDENINNHDFLHQNPRLLAANSAELITNHTPMSTSDMLYPGAENGTKMLSPSNSQRLADGKSMNHDLSLTSPMQTCRITSLRHSGTDLISSLQTDDLFDDAQMSTSTRKNTFIKNAPAQHPTCVFFVDNLAIAPHRHVPLEFQRMVAAVDFRYNPFRGLSVDRPLPALTGAAAGTTEDSRGQSVISIVVQDSHSDLELHTPHSAYLGHQEQQFVTPQQHAHTEVPLLSVPHPTSSQPALIIPPSVRQISSNSSLNTPQMSLGIAMMNISTPQSQGGATNVDDIKKQFRVRKKPGSVDTVVEDTACEIEYDIKSDESTHTSKPPDPITLAVDCDPGEETASQELEIYEILSNINTTRRKASVGAKPIPNGPDGDTLDIMNSQQTTNTINGPDHTYTETNKDLTNTLFADNDYVTINNQNNRVNTDIFYEGKTDRSSLDDNYPSTSAQSLAASIIHNGPQNHSMNNNTNNNEAYIVQPHTVSSKPRSIRPNNASNNSLHKYGQQQEQFNIASYDTMSAHSGFHGRDRSNSHHQYDHNGMNDGHNLNNSHSNNHHTIRYSSPPHNQAITMKPSASFDPLVLSGTSIRTSNRDLLDFLHNENNWKSLPPAHSLCSIGPGLSSLKPAVSLYSLARAWLYLPPELRICGCSNMLNSGIRVRDDSFIMSFNRFGRKTGEKPRRKFVPANAPSVASSLAEPLYEESDTEDGTSHTQLHESLQFGLSRPFKLDDKGHPKHGAMPHGKHLVEQLEAHKRYVATGGDPNALAIYDSQQLHDAQRYPYRFLDGMDLSTADNGSYGGPVLLGQPHHPGSNASGTHFTQLPLHNSNITNSGIVAAGPSHSISYPRHANPYPGNLTGPNPTRALHPQRTMQHHRNLLSHDPTFVESYNPHDLGMQSLVRVGFSQHSQQSDYQDQRNTSLVLAQERHRLAVRDKLAGQVMKTLETASQNGNPMSGLYGNGFLDPNYAGRMNSGVSIPYPCDVQSNNSTITQLTGGVTQGTQFTHATQQSHMSRQSSHYSIRSASAAITYDKDDEEKSRKIKEESSTPFVHPHDGLLRDRGHVDYRTNHYLADKLSQLPISTKSTEGDNFKQQLEQYFFPFTKITPVTVALFALAVPAFNNLVFVYFCSLCQCRKHVFEAYQFLDLTWLERHSTSDLRPLVAWSRSKQQPRCIGEVFLFFWQLLLYHAQQIVNYFLSFTPPQEPVQDDSNASVSSVSQSVPSQRPQRHQQWRDFVCKSTTSDNSNIFDPLSMDLMKVLYKVDFAKKSVEAAQAAQAAQQQPQQQLQLQNPQQSQPVYNINAPTPASASQPTSQPVSDQSLVVPFSHPHQSYPTVITQADLDDEDITDPRILLERDSAYHVELPIPLRLPFGFYGLCYSCCVRQLKTHNNLPFQIQFSDLLLAMVITHYGLLEFFFPPGSYPEHTLQAQPAGAPARPQKKKDDQWINAGTRLRNRHQFLNSSTGGLLRSDPTTGFLDLSIVNLIGVVSASSGGKSLFHPPCTLSTGVILSSEGVLVPGELELTSPDDHLVDLMASLNVEADVMSRMNSQYTDVSSRASQFSSWTASPHDSNRSTLYDTSLAPSQNLRGSIFSNALFVNDNNPLLPGMSFTGNNARTSDIYISAPATPRHDLRNSQCVDNSSPLVASEGINNNPLTDTVNSNIPNVSHGIHGLRDLHNRPTDSLFRNSAGPYQYAGEYDPILSNSSLLSPTPDHQYQNSQQAYHSNRSADFFDFDPDQKTSILTGNNRTSAIHSKVVGIGDGLNDQALFLTDSPQMRSIHGLSRHNSAVPAVAPALSLSTTSSVRSIRSIHGSVQSIQRKQQKQKAQNLIVQSQMARQHQILQQQNESTTRPDVIPPTDIPQNLSLPIHPPQQPPGSYQHQYQPQHHNQHQQTNINLSNHNAPNHGHYAAPSNQYQHTHQPQHQPHFNVPAQPPNYYDVPFISSQQSNPYQSSNQYQQQSYNSQYHPSQSQHYQQQPQQYTHQQPPQHLQQQQQYQQQPQQQQQQIQQNGQQRHTLPPDASFPPGSYSNY